MSIIQVPNPILTTPAKEVTGFDRKLSLLIKQMIQTLRATRNPRGVGLAAPQIGESWRVFITRPNLKSPIRVIINPVIVFLTEDKDDTPPKKPHRMEGCLSIPQIWGQVKRATSLTLKYQDEKAVIHSEDFHGFLATIIQHETDHVNGILFTQRVLEQKGKLYQPAKNENGKEILEEIRIS